MRIMSINDDAFQSLIERIEQIVPAGVGNDPRLAEYLSREAVGLAGSLREECERLEELEREREQVATDVAMGPSTTMQLGYALALTRLEQIAKDAVGKGLITAELRSAVQALEERAARLGKADA